MAHQSTDKFETVDVDLDDNMPQDQNTKSKSKKRQGEGGGGGGDGDRPEGGGGGGDGDRPKDKEHDKKETDKKHKHKHEKQPSPLAPHRLADASFLYTERHVSSDGNGILETNSWQGTLGDFETSPLVYRLFELLKKKKSTVFNDVSAVNNFKNMIVASRVDIKECVKQLGDFFEQVTESHPMEEDEPLLQYDWIINGCFFTKEEREDKGEGDDQDDEDEDEDDDRDVDTEYKSLANCVIRYTDTTPLFEESGSQDGSDGGSHGHGDANNETFQGPLKKYKPSALVYDLFELLREQKVYYANDVCQRDHYDAILFDFEMLNKKQLIKDLQMFFDNITNSTSIKTTAEPIFTTWNMNGTSATRESDE